MATAIEFNNISKLYRLGMVGTGTLAHDLKRWWTINIRHKEDPYLRIGETNDLRKSQEQSRACSNSTEAQRSGRSHRSTKGESDYVWALKDIDFKVEQGDVVGIIGKNGAGKSTLLKILSRVTAPTTGTIRARGRIGSLLEVGTGFHPEMTGRENIYMNGAILGMTKQEIAKKLDEIIDFSGCERYIDTPVKRYSSGMMVRLGFAVAAHLDPEILVVDEVLAVGDAEFQKKAIGKMQDVSRGEGRTVLFVSHNMTSIKQLCQKCVWLDNGKVKDTGSVNTIVDNYLASNSSKEFNTFLPIDSNRRNEDPSIHITDFRLLNEMPKTGDVFRFEIVVENRGNEAKQVEAAVAFKNMQYEPVTQFFSKDTNSEILLSIGENTISVVTPPLPLVEGNYHLNLWIGSNQRIIDWISDCFNLRIESGSIDGINAAENRGYSIIFPAQWTTK